MRHYLQKYLVGSTWPFGSAIFKLEKCWCLFEMISSDEFHRKHMRKILYLFLFEEKRGVSNLYSENGSSTTIKP
jgi:hypothetical protein